MKEIFTSSFNKQKENITNFLSTINNDILDQMKIEYENVLKHLTNVSEAETSSTTITINSLSQSLSNSLNSEANKFLTSSKEIYSEGYLYSFNLEKGDSNIKMLDISSFEFPYLQEKIEKGVETLQSYCDNRFEKEKVLFKERIDNSIISGYNKSITDFSTSFGQIYLNKILHQITEIKVQRNLNNIERTLENDKEFLLSILQKESMLLDTLRDSIKTLYELLSNEISTNLNYIINTELNNVINNFKINTKDQITESFSEYIITTINGDNFKKAFTQNVIKLFPKTFTDGFIEKLKSNYDSLLDFNDLGNFKTSVTTQISNSKTNIENALQSFKTEINNELSPKTIAEMDSDVEDMIYNLKIYIKDDYNVYPSKFEFNLSNESKNSLQEFINKIKTLISPINEAYSGNDDTIKQQLEEKINSFGDYVSVVQNNFPVNDIISNTLTSLNNLKSIQDSISQFIIDKVSNIEEVLKEINTEVKKDNRLRNLEEFEITRILDNVNEIKKSFEKVQKNVIALNEYIQMSKDYPDFNKNMKNMIEHISDPIDNSLINLKDYLNETQYNSFETNIKTQSENIKKYLQDFYNNENIYISDSIKVISDLPSIYNSIENEIKTKTDNYLTTYSNKIFNQLKSINIDSNKITNKEKLTLGSFKEDVCGVPITFGATVPNYNYRYMIQFKYENFAIITNASVYGDTSISVSYQNSEKKASIQGTIGAGDMALKINNKLKNEKTDLTIAQESKSVTFKKNLSQKEYYSVRECKRTWYTFWIGKKCWWETRSRWKDKTETIVTKPSRYESTKQNF